MKVCKSCNYPHKGRSCNNPACFANPNVPQETKDRWNSEIAKARIEAEERTRLRQLWGASFSR